MAAVQLSRLDIVKEWLGVTNDADDPLLDRLLTAASRYVEAWMNRTIAVTAYTETRDGNGGYDLMLANYPVVSVESVTVCGASVSAAVGYYDTGFVFDETRLTLRHRRFPRERGAVTVSYHAGYAQVPADVEQAVCELVGLRYRERDRIGSVSKSIGGETVAFSQKDMSDAIRTLLMQYRKVVPL